MQSVLCASFIAFHFAFFFFLTISIKIVNFFSCCYRELTEGRSHYLKWWWVHEVEGEKVVDTHSLEGEHCAGHVGPLYLRHGCGQHLVPVSPLCVQPGHSYE